MEKGYAAKREAIKSICTHIGIPNTRAPKQPVKINPTPEFIALIELAKKPFGLSGKSDDNDTEKGKMGLESRLAHDVSRILYAWSGSSIKNEGIATDTRSAASPIKVSVGPPLPSYLAWAKDMRKTIEAEGGRTGSAIEAEVGVRWKALKEASPGGGKKKSVRLNGFCIIPYDGSS
jgi:hypothetical protein